MNLQTIKTQFDHAKQRAIAQYHTDRRPLKFFRAYTDALYALLRQTWQFHAADCADLCLLAVGGLGRGEVYPHSDLDLAIVAPNELSETEQEVVAKITQQLWDWQLSPALRSGSIAQLSELAKHDLTADTAFLETQWLSGSLKTAESCLKTLNWQRDTVAFIEGKLLEMQQRHAKQPSFPLEPNIKHCAGGLRDIHTMMWLAKVQDLSANFDKLRQMGILNAVELGLIRNSHRHLARMRMDLHLANPRAEERLTFDLQAQIGLKIGLHTERRQASELLMHQTYRALKTVRQLNGIILPMLRGRVYSSVPRHIVDLDENYYCIGKQIAAKDLKLFEKNPEHLFIVIEKLYQNNQLNEIAPKTLREWWIASRQINETFYQNAENRQRFLKFFQQGQGITRIMRLLNLYGILSRYIPKWHKIVGLLQHDLFHIYPVDEHSLMVLHQMRRFTQEEHHHEFPLASELMQHFELKYILYLAAVFHDIAKGRNGAHEILGMADAQRFANDHNLPPEHAELLVWLVQSHLLMSQVAQKQDISDPNVIAQFCQHVQTPTKLIALYLLTLADIQGTNPKIWNSWKAQLLQTLFQAALKRLSDDQFNPQQIMQSREHEAQMALEKIANPKQIKQLWQALGQAYFVSHAPEIIAWHTPFLVQNPEQAQAHIQKMHDNLLRVMVYLPNGERLFTRLCRLFSQYGLDIMAARAFITAHNFILDTFHVAFDENTDPNEYERIQAAILQKLNQFAHQPFDISNVQTIKSRRVKHIPLNPTLAIVPDEKAGWYNIEIVAANRRALLADLTEIFARHNVRLRHANIATLGERVEDRFLVHVPEWQQDPMRQLAFQRDLLAQLV